MDATDPAAAPLPPLTPRDVVAAEATRRPRVGLAALIAAILVVAANVLQQSTYSDFPRVYVLEALRNAAGESIGRPGLRSAQILFLDDHSGSLLVVSILQALSIGLIGFLLVFLADASLARGATLPRPTRVLALLGATLSALGVLASQIALTISVSDFASSSDHGTHAAHQALRGGGVAATSLINLVGTLALAAGFVLIAIGAMRIGLLTRFLGVLGAIVGVLTLLGPLIGSQSWIVQAFWLAMAGVMVLGRWPSGMPPAWDSGEAAPWPSQQEIREAKQRGRAPRGGGRGGWGGGRVAPEPQAAKPAEAEATTASPATSARKKRKRRS